MYKLYIKNNISSTTIFFLFFTLFFIFFLLIPKMLFSNFFSILFSTTFYWDTSKIIYTSFYSWVDIFRLFPKSKISRSLKPFSFEKGSFWPKSEKLGPFWNFSGRTSVLPKIWNEIFVKFLFATYIKNNLEPNLRI